MRILCDVTFKSETENDITVTLDGRGDNNGDTSAVNALKIVVNKDTADASLLKFALDNGRQLALEVTSA